MPAPENTFKTRLLAGETLIGCWLSMGEAAMAEMMGTTGFDWLVIDGEHAPNDIRSIRDQLMALEASPSSAIVRVPIGEAWIIKQVLDAGAQTVLVPLVETVEEAEALVRACRYPTAGIRGAGAASARASSFSGIKDYVRTANEQICLLIQIESRAGIAALDDILAVEGIDGVFIGPADLASDMGHWGDSSQPEVQEVIMDALGRISAAGKPAGILSFTEEPARKYIEAGARFVAVGSDVSLMVNNARALASSFKS